MPTDDRRWTNAAGRVYARKLVIELEALRIVTRQLDEELHLPITDILGREWRWRDGDLYAHDGMAWPRQLIERPDVGLPVERALDNPNYRWCDTCRGPAVRLGRRRVPVATVVDAGGRLLWTAAEALDKAYTRAERDRKYGPTEEDERDG